ncbi:MAG: hypothetical protein HZA08_11530 [Nitrospirae bacterium]|nr:hypothetical protein [Nitrospirota bacterium]
MQNWKIRKRVISVLLIGFMSFLQVSTVLADEVSDQVDEALKLYKEGKYSQAASELEFAVQQIREKQAENLKDIFPAPLQGWKADKPEVGASGAMMLGGGVTASIRYYKSSAKQSEKKIPVYGMEGDEGEEGGEVTEIRLEIVTDSPLLQGMLPLFANPALAGSQGGKVTKVKGYRGILKKQGDDGGAELSLVVANKILVILRGNDGAADTDVLAYGNAINYQALEKLVAP